MEQSKTIAVLLPVYNNDNPLFFKDSIESILNQSYNNIKILVGVDGPVEGELNRSLMEYETTWKVNIIRFNENRGLACVLNDLLTVCFRDGYEYIARMDADDFSVPNRFEEQMRFLIEHPAVDVVGGAIEEIDESSNRNGKRVVYPFTHEECRKFFRYRDPLAHPAVMFRKKYFDKAKGYRNEYRKNQDTMLWFDGFRNGCVFANIEETVLYFRVTNDFYLRRNGWVRAKKMLNDRFDMNKELNYDISAYIFGFMMFCMTVTPPFLKKWLYRIR